LLTLQVLHLFTNHTVAFYCDCFVVGNSMPIIRTSLVSSSQNETTELQRLWST